MGTMVELRKASPMLVLAGRAGYAAKGVVYIVIGTLAARAATGSSGRATDSKGALLEIGDSQYGTIALVLVGIGLLGYMVWRLVAAATDAEGKGDKPTSLVLRLAQAARGIAYGVLGVRAFQLLDGGEGGGGDPAESWSARLMELPYGRFLVGAIALGVIGYAAYQFYRASSAEKVRKHLDLGQAGAMQARWIVRLGQFGIAARAAIFTVAGVFLVRSAWEYDPDKAAGFAESLQAVANADNGSVLFGAVAFGLIAYGIYQIASARYRRMRGVG